MRNQIVEAVKRAMADDGRPQAEIARESAIDPAILCRFHRGYGGLSLDSLDRLCRALGLELRAVGRDERERAS